ncbi:ENR1 protein, partial [Smithornis capensis]|nr:ENR1 protein [Smithornis capensis]
KEQDLPIAGQNLFVNLATRIVKELNVSNCWVCGGPLETEMWPWKGTSLNALEILQLNLTTTPQAARPEGWVLNTIPVGQECLNRQG